ncbi:glutathione S-transferase [Thioalkalivibrio denitrificans]|uniref:Glutathione S-transferase n=1 Tax=Thioalkalivibrio denitrificans TaxID=108003 RepID=A0A1V3NIA1_9GAMM|nr:glutathione S-transferase family protein [Thioalkalivibrio denitrificans]OOG24801.1 glutathione S-transferase [Thioalkalivibrio denitrificans]
MTILYYFHSSPQSQRVRLALACKGVPFEDRPLAWDDDETFFDLGIARSAPVLQLDNTPLLTDSADILQRIDELFPGTPPLVEGRIHEAAWQALLDWRSSCDAVLERLYAPVRPAYREIGADAGHLAAYKEEIRHRFGMSLEALANDRYDGFAQFSRMSRLAQLARHLAANRFYMGEISIADMLLCADLYPLQLHDGITLPVDLMYYFERVETCCGVSPGDNLTA